MLIQKTAAGIYFCFHSILFDRLVVLVVKASASRVGDPGFESRLQQDFSRSSHTSDCKKILLRHGVPQGGVLSPTLFLLFINDLVSELPKGIKAALYADDLVIWCKEEYATTATYRMQLAADKLNSWTEKWCVAVNKDKSSTTLFTLSPKQKAGTITLGGTPLKEDEEATYLGITFDKR